MIVDAVGGPRVFSYSGSRVSGRLAAPAQRAAFTLVLGDDERDIAATQIFSGPPLGPWAPAGPMIRDFVLPWQHQLVRDPEPRDLALPMSAVFAGDLVAYSERTPDEDAGAIGRRLVVAELRASTTCASRSSTSRCAPTGASRSRSPKPTGSTRSAWGPLPGASTAAPSPSTSLRRPPARTSSCPSTAGCNDCLLIADVNAPAAPAPAAGPCPRTEVAIDDSGPNPDLRRTLPATLRCAAGERRRVVVRLTERGYRALRKKVARERGALVRVTPRGADDDTTRDDLLVLPRGAS